MGQRVQCADYFKVKKQLLERYDEVPTHLGNARLGDDEGRGDNFVMFTNKTTGNFSFAIVYGKNNRAGFRRGWTCLLASGYNWQYNPRPPGELTPDKPPA